MLAKVRVKKMLKDLMTNVAIPVIQVANKTVKTKVVTGETAIVVTATETQNRMVVWASVTRFIICMRVVVDVAVMTILL